MTSWAMGSILSSSSGETRIPMTFTDKWGEGNVFDWYKTLQKSQSSMYITRLQVCIDNGKPPHRFILAYLPGGVVCRFDRRPEEANPGSLVLETLGGRRHWKAADECRTLHQNDPEFMMLQHSTICEIDMDMPPKTDLRLILSACFALSQDTKARDYDLLKYNCYFFSWTITMVVIRHVLPFRIPAPDDVARSLDSALVGLSKSITGKIVTALLAIVVDVIAAARQKAGGRIKKGLYLGERLVWQLPMSAMCFAYRQVLKLQLYFGLEDVIRRKTHERMLSICTTLLHDVLNREDIDKRVEKRLWINELMEDIRTWLRDQMAVTFWDVVLDIIAAVHGNVDGQKALADIENNPSRISRLKASILGDSQWIQLWNEALSAALPAARDAVRARGQDSITQHASTQLHNEMFDIAFTAANGAALAAAKNVVSRTQPALNNPKRDQMWEIVWSVWDDMWETAHRKTRTIVVPIAEEAVEEIVALVTDRVQDRVRESQGAQVWVQYQVNK
ncbi:unnamed protein product [Rhizoctonia solani]|uniref:Uncharacterized protein n=1 Tax=Rhizoctonia solani TaxID=456999 RepID=A0A8H3AXW2_9AGAM|nr:unnamed protein product [Rhizoctonia solani]